MPSKLSELYGWNPMKIKAGDLEQVYNRSKLALSVGEKDLYQSTGVVGIEVEAEGVIAPHAGNVLEGYFPYVWAKDKDNSLRNNGMEFISTPLSGKYINMALNLLSEAFKGQRAINGYAEPFFTDLCGVHVHMNVRDFNVEQLANLLLTYVVFEKSLYALAGNRDKNIFCLPVGVVAPNWREFLSVWEKDNNRLVDLTQKSEKYSALNIKPITNLGTVEFRHMEGNLDLPRLRAWISIILLMRDYALKRQWKELQEEIFALNTNSEYKNFAEGVFQGWLKHLDDSTLWNNMADGVRKAKLFCIPARDVYVNDANKNKKEVAEKEIEAVDNDPAYDYHRRGDRSYRFNRVRGLWYTWEFDGDGWENLRACNAADMGMIPENFQRARVDYYPHLIGNQNRVGARRAILPGFKKAVDAPRPEIERIPRGPAPKVILDMEQMANRVGVKFENFIADELAPPRKAVAAQAFAEWAAKGEQIARDKRRDEEIAAERAKLIAEMQANARNRQRGV